MQISIPIRSRFPASFLVPGATLALVLLAAAPARAGEIKIGAEPLPTDDSGKITAAGRKAAVDTLHSAPGEELWTVHVWASLDRGAPGPLYVEFWDKWNGKDIKVPWMYEDQSYDGRKYYSATFDLEGNVGFNAGHTYRVRFVQVNDKNKDVILAKGAKLTLVKTPAPEGASDDEGEDEGEDEAVSEQDAMDTLAGPDEADIGDEPQTPPETEASKKKGCSVARPGAGTGLAGMLVLFALGAWRRR